MSRGKIWATAECRRALMEKFGVNPSTITTSLNFQSFGFRNRDIRRYAVNFLQSAVWIDETKFIK